MLSRLSLDFVEHFALLYFFLREESSQEAFNHEPEPEHIQNL
jgi:hypothetical protein